MNNKIYGFSLLEVLLILAIFLGICLFFAPYYNRIQAKYEAGHTLNHLQIQLRHLPHDALLYRQRIVLCSSSDFKQCDNNWAHGYIVFIDKNRNNQRDADEMILRVHKLQLKHGNLYWNGFLSQTKLMFDAQSGLPLASNGTFKYCSYILKTEHKKLILTRMGQMRIEPMPSC